MLHRFDDREAKVEADLLLCGKKVDPGPLVLPMPAKVSDKPQILTLKYLVGSSQKLVFEGNGFPQLEGTTQPGPNAIFREGTSGLEYQMVDEAVHQDGKSPLTISGALYQLAGLERTHARPAGQLNRSKIVVNGSHIEHWLNGNRVVAVDTASEEFRTAASKAPARTRRALDYLSQEGPIAIQTHTGAVWIGNIKLRRLKPFP